LQQTHRQSLRSFLFAAELDIVRQPMAPRVSRDWFSLEPEAGWLAEQHPECITLTASPEGGSFQLSAARKEASPIALAEVREMASHNQSFMGEAFPVVIGGFKGLSVRYQHEGSFWRRFWLAQGHLFIFATYNGPPEYCAAEESAIEAMLSTLRTEDGAA
jgi:hypothetical protein